MERLERQQTQLELDALWDAKAVKAIPQHFVWLSTPVPVTDRMTDRSGNVLEVVPDKHGSASWRSMSGSLLGTWLVIATSGGRDDPSPVKRSSE